jgi:hypothetical protein
MKANKLEPFSLSMEYNSSKNHEYSDLLKFMCKNMIKEPLAHKLDCPILLSPLALITKLQWKAFELLNLDDVACKGHYWESCFSIQAVDFIGGRQFLPIFY